VSLLSYGFVFTAKELPVGTRWALLTACLPGVSDKPVAFLILVRGNLVKRLPEYTNEGHRFAFVIELPESHSTRFPTTWKDMERREYETYGVKPFFDVPIACPPLAPFGFVFNQKRLNVTAPGSYQS
jgi:hypothetical protein